MQSWGLWADIPAEGVLGAAGRAAPNTAVQQQWICWLNSSRRRTQAGKPSMRSSNLGWRCGSMRRLPMMGLMLLCSACQASASARSGCVGSAARKGCRPHVAVAAWLH
jgi:hypothetical protein